MRYCVGCSHCVFEPGESGYRYLEDGGREPMLHCSKGHWMVALDQTTSLGFNAFMESANGCVDYAERPDTGKVDLSMARAENTYLQSRVNALQELAKTFPTACKTCPYRDTIQNAQVCQCDDPQDVRKSGRDYCGFCGLTLPYAKGGRAAWELRRKHRSRKVAAGGRKK